jgi:hypothetical protein
LAGHLNAVLLFGVTAGAWQPWTPHPNKDVSDDGDQGEENEASHENTVKLFRFGLCQTR